MKPMRPRTAFAYFAAYGVLLYAVTRWLMPLFVRAGWMPVLAWFFCGSVFVFGPLLLHALWLTRKLPGGLGARLRLRRLDRGDWLWAAGGVLFAMLGSGLLVLLHHLLSQAVPWLPPLNMQTPFMAFDGFAPHQRWMLLLWFPAFLCIIFGEEFMWRGVLLPRMALYAPATAWVWNALFWLGFHTAFGLDIIYTLIPVLLVVPYIVQKRGNTWLGIIIHGIYNAAGFLFIAFGGGA